MRFGAELIATVREPTGLYQCRVTEYEQPPGVGDGICRALAYYWLLAMLRPNSMGLAAPMQGPTQQEVLRALDQRWDRFAAFVYQETNLNDDHRREPKLKTIFADGLSLDFEAIHVWTPVLGTDSLMDDPDGLRQHFTAPLDRATGFVMSLRFMSGQDLAGHSMSVFLDRNRAFFFEPNLGVFHFAHPGVLCWFLAHEYLPFFERSYGSVMIYRLVRVRPIKPRPG